MAELSPSQKKQMEKELKDASSLQEMFDILGEYYDLENCKPGFISKGVMISKLGDAVKYLKAQPKKRNDVYY